MSDSDVRLAARIARHAGLYHPKDWLRIYREHTHYEWLLQVALSQVDPWGDDRADQRAATMTANLISSQFSSENQPDYEQLKTGLQNYLPIHKPDEEDI